MPARLYEETIVSWLNGALFLIVTGALLFTLVYQRTVGPLGTRPASNQLLAALLVLFLVIGMTAFRLRIVIGEEGVRAAYGSFGRTIPWGNIEAVRADETSAVWYGGWGIRLGRVGGKWRLVYNVVGPPRVVLVLKAGWYGEFAFSTGNPQEVIRVICRELAKR